MKVGDCFGREQEIEEIVTILDQGSNVFVEGLRRMGKTMIVRELQLRLNQMAKHHYYLYVDVGSCKDSAEFFGRVTKALDIARPDLEKWLAIGKKKLSAIESISLSELTIKLANQANLGGSSRAGFVAALEQITKDEDCRFVLILDEFPLMLWNCRDGQPNEIVLALKDINDQNGYVRFIYTGSTGLQYSTKALAKRRITIEVKRNTETLTVRGFREDHLGLQFSEQVATAYCMQIFLDHMEDELPKIHEMIAKTCSNVPYWIETVWQKLGELDRDFAMSEVDNVIQKLLDQGDSFHLNQYQDRLDGYEAEFGENPLKEGILFELCKYPNGTSKENIRAVLMPTPDYQDGLFRDALNELLQDHYLIQSEGHLTFASDLMRRHWEAKS